MKLYSKYPDRLEPLWFRSLQRVTVHKDGSATLELSKAQSVNSREVVLMLDRNELLAIVEWARPQWRKGERNRNPETR